MSEIAAASASFELEPGIPLGDALWTSARDFYNDSVTGTASERLDRTPAGVNLACWLL